MGASASTLAAITDNAEFANLLTSEFQRLKAEGVADADLKEHFEKLLKSKEGELLAKFSQKEAAENKAETVEDALADAEAAADLKIADSQLLDDLKSDDEVELTEQQVAAKHVKFAEACKSSATSIKEKTGLSFVCCVDGSECSDRAFKTVMHLQRKQDSICIFHAYKAAKNLDEYPDLQPDNIRRRYYNLFYGIGLYPTERKHKFVFEERGNKSAVRVLKKYVYQSFSEPSSEENVKPDFVVMGYSGRKHKALSIGSTTDKALRSFHIPVLIVKKMPPMSFATQGRANSIAGKSRNNSVAAGGAPSGTSSGDQSTPASISQIATKAVKIVEAAGNTKEFVANDKAGGGDDLVASVSMPELKSPPVSTSTARQFMPTTSYLMAVDFSDASKIGLDVLLRLVRPRDTLRIVHVSTNKTLGSKIKELRNYYEDALYHYGPVDSAFEIINANVDVDQTQVENQTDSHQVVSTGDDSKNTFHNSKRQEEHISVMSVIADAIADHSNKVDPHILAIAPRVKPNLLSHITEYIIAKVRASVLVCKL